MLYILTGWDLSIFEVASTILIKASKSINPLLSLSPKEITKYEVGEKKTKKKAQQKQ